MAAASVFVMEELDKPTYDQHTELMQTNINVGFGSDITIKELAETVGKTVDYRGQIIYDPSKPDGTPRKLMNSDRLKGMGWCARVNLVDGLARAYQDFLSQIN